MRLLFRLILPLLLATALFVWLQVFHYGYDAVTLNGQDPWALLFYGLGGVAVPAVIGTIVASVIKLVRRNISYLNVWLVVFTVAAGVLLVSNYLAAKYDHEKAQQ